MGDAAGELTDRLHFLRLPERVLGVAQGGRGSALGGDVAADSLDQPVGGDSTPFDDAHAAVQRVDSQLEALRRA